MSRLLVLTILIGGCNSKPAGSQAAAPTVGAGPEPSIPVPPVEAEGIRSKGSDGSMATGVSAPDDPALCALTPATKQRAQDPTFQLKPEEGTITIARIEGKPGTLGTAEIKVMPGPGFKIAKQIPIKLLLEQPTGIALAKTCMRAGGRYEAQGDAATLSEKALTFSVSATADKPGSFEIAGVFQFGVCRDDACMSRVQPIAIHVAAK
jgi:hypothetical protein